MKIFGLVALGMIMGAGLAGGFLIEGDVAILAFQSDNPDAFAWVTLRDIAADTTISFTDSSVSNNLFRWTEHLDSGGAGLTWTHGSPVAAGTVVHYQSGSGTWSMGTVGGTMMGLSNDGDQIFAYTGMITDLGGTDSQRGDPSGATMLFGVNFANAGWLTEGASGSGLSYIPNGLTDGSTAVHLGNFDNGYYAGITSGTREQILAAIANPANWVLSNAVQDQGNWAAAGQTFNVIPEPSTMALVGLAMLCLRGVARRKR